MRRLLGRIARNPARWRFGPTRCHGIDANTALCRLNGQTRRQRVDTALGGAVRHAVDAARGNRRHVDNRTAGLFEHVRQRRVTAPQGGEQRAAHFGLDLVFLVMLKRLGPDGAAHVVDEDVQPAKALHRSGHDALAIGTFFHVGRECQHVGRRGSQFIAQLEHQIRAVDQHQAGALGGQAQGHAAANTLGRPGDHRNLLVKTWIHDDYLKKARKNGPSETMTNAIRRWRQIFRSENSPAECLGHE